VPRQEVLVGGVELARKLDLWLSVNALDVVVDRLPGTAYPRPGVSTRLFALAPGQVGRYQTNFRFTGCACNPSWYYENWVVHICNGQVEHDRFVRGEPDRDVDHRVHLYGGTGHRVRRRRDAAPRRRALPRHHPP
jgi:hypothetical protein